MHIPAIQPPSALLDDDVEDLAQIATDSPQANGQAASATAKTPTGLRALQVIGSASLLTTALGVVTSKIIAVVAGAEGFGLLGLYRTLGHLVSLSLALEMTTVIVHRASLAPSIEEARRVFRATWHLFLCQALAIVALTILGAGWITQWLFGRPAANPHIWEIRLVLLMTSGVLALRAVVALLEGRLRFKQAAGANIITSLATVVAVYPLLLLGHAGLALIIGSTCFAGAAVGLLFVWRAYELSRQDFQVHIGQPALLTSLPASFILTVRTIMVTGTLLILQAIINRYYGATALGWYNAATLVEGSAMLVLMSSMKSYYLPSLGQLGDVDAKATLANRLLSLLLVLILGCGIMLLLAAPYLVRIAFSAQFSPVAGLLSILSLSLVAQVISWFYTIYLLHQQNYLPHFLLDALWSVLLLCGAGFATYRGWPLESVIWFYVVAHTITALLYVTFLRLRYGAAMLSRLNTCLACGSWALIFLAYYAVAAGWQAYVLLIAMLTMAGAGLWYRAFGPNARVAARGSGK
jgi:O-antigen/teichoic acid export membrane protein